MCVVCVCVCERKTVVEEEREGGTEQRKRYIDGGRVGAQEKKILK